MSDGEAERSWDEEGKALAAERAAKPAAPPPLGAHNDLTHPGGPLRPMSPVRDAPSGGPKDNGSVGVGVALALLWIALWFAVSALLDSLAYGHPVVEMAWPWVYLVVNLGSLVAVHVYALAKDKPRVLVGFWSTLVVGVLVFVVTCFALVLTAFG